MMNLFIVSGSHRGVEAESGRIAEYIKKNFSKLFDNTELLDLSKTDIPLYADDLLSSDEGKKVWSPIEKKIQAADALVVISPEWGGMVPPGLKNFLLLTSFNKCVAHKPALLVGVSASRGGAYPIAELRMSGYKNAYINWIPDHVIIRDCEKMLTGSKDENNVYIEKRLEYSIKVLKEFTDAFKKVRESGVLNYKLYPHGM